MATFLLKTEKGQTHTFKARSWSQANQEAHYICRKNQDRRISMTTVKVEKEELPAAVLAGHDMVREMMMANPQVNEAMDLVETKYIAYWKHQRERWFNMTREELDETLTQFYGPERNGTRGREFYRSDYYMMDRDGALSPSPQVYERWLNKIRREALEAKDQSIINMIRAIVKIAGKDPITHFKVINVSKGKAGLEGVIKVNDIIKRVYAIYAEGPIQRLHIRYLIK